MSTSRDFSARFFKNFFFFIDNKNKIFYNLMVVLVEKNINMAIVQNLAM